MQSTIEEKFLV